MYSDFAVQRLKKEKKPTTIEKLRGNLKNLFLGSMKML
jgi:hypothetical protein